MKVTTIIDPSREEEVVIYAHQESALVREIARIADDAPTELIGYQDKAAEPLDMDAVCCFTVQNGKVYAQTHNGVFGIKYRLYQLEEILPRHFIKINQSCVANVRQIQRFDTAFSGTLRVNFKNGYVDYVSRRHLKSVKERLGLR